MSFQHLLYRFQDQMFYVISTSAIQVSGPDVLCNLFYVQYETHDNE